MPALIASIATAIGIMIAVGQLRQAQKQRVREFESLFLARYWELIDELPAKVALGFEGENEATESDLKAFAQYLRLCEDECEQRRLLWISTATWQVWADGMRFELSNGSFAALWRNHEHRFPTSFQHLRALVEDKADPSSGRHPLWRWMRGLEGGL